jgi:hypothetical protein
MSEAEIKAAKAEAWDEGFKEASDDYLRRYGTGNPYR